MGAITGTKIALSLGGAASVTTAVALPIVLSITNRDQSKKEQNEKPISSLASLTRCENSTQTNKKGVNFGDNQVSDVCGTDEEKNQDLTSHDSYTTFFKEQGGAENENWNENKNLGSGTQQCLNREKLSPGVIFDSSSTNTGVQHLGLCNNETHNKTLFVKKRKSPTEERYGEKGTFLTCQNDCWKSNPGTDNGKVLLTEDKKENGREVKFFKQ